MRPYFIILMTSVTAGGGALAGSMLGNAAGPMGLKGGALLGGLVGVMAGVQLAAGLGWLATAETRGARVGGAIGFLVAAAIAVTHLDTPITPAVSSLLAGVGVLLGAGATRAA